MENKVNSKSIEAIKEVLRNYLKEKGLRNTPERYTILEEIYNYDKHFNVDDRREIGRASCRERV